MSPPPTSFSVQSTSKTWGNRTKSNHLSECFWSHMWPSFSLELGLFMCVSVCPLDRTPSLWHLNTDLPRLCSQYATHVFHTVRQSVLAPVNMKLELLFWFCGQKTLVVRLSTVKSWIVWEAFEKLLQFFSGLYIQLWPWILQPLCHRSYLWAWGW